MPTVIDLTTLAPTEGFIIVGDAAGDSAGYSVSDAGDVNGDGIDDFIVGAPGGDNGGTDAGEAYVIFGKAGATRANIDLTALAQLTVSSSRVMRQVTVLDLAYRRLVISTAMGSMI